MAGRNISEEKKLPTVKISQRINFRKSVFLFISITELKTRLVSEENSYISISDDIVDLIDLSNTLKDFPFLVKDSQILKYINPDNSDSVYSTIDRIAKDANVENLFIFYQGFSIKRGTELVLQLRKSISTLSNSDFITMNRIADRLIIRSDLNTVVFLDCSFSAHALQTVSMNNFVIIAASGVNQHSSFVHSNLLERKVSLFSYEVIRLFQDIGKGDLNNISLYDFFFELRRRIIIQHNTYSHIFQIPEISTRNIAPYMKIGLENPFLKSKDSPNNKIYSVEDLKDLITDGKIYDCLIALANTGKKLEPDQKTAIILLKNQYKRNETAKITAQVTNEEYNVSRFSLSRNILEFIGLLELD